MIPEGFQAMLAGFVNIHTPQAVMMMAYFEQLKDPQSEPRPRIEVGYLYRQRFEQAHIDHSVHTFHGALGGEHA